MREIRNMGELKMSQVELRHKIDITQMQLLSHAKAVRELLNPITYINLAISKLDTLEDIAVSFYKGYHTVKEKITEYRNRKTT